MFVKPDARTDRHLTCQGLLPCVHRGGQLQAMVTGWAVASWAWGGGRCGGWSLVVRRGRFSTHQQVRGSRAAGQGGPCTPCHACCALRPVEREGPGSAWCWGGMGVHPLHRPFSVLSIRTWKGQHHSIPPTPDRPGPPYNTAGRQCNMACCLAGPGAGRAWGGGGRRGGCWHPMATHTTCRWVAAGRLQGPARAPPARVFTLN